MHVSVAALLHSPGKQRSYGPYRARRQIFNSLQSLSHPGIKAKANLVSQHLVWPAIEKDYSTWT